MIFTPTGYATQSQISVDIEPYRQYWWRRRPVANSYTETRQTAYSAGVGYDHTSNGKTYYYLNAKRRVKYSGAEDSSYYYATLKYSSSITIDQSSGTITLVSPKTYTFTNDDDVYDSSVYSRFQNKYVQGFLGATSKTFYIPSSAYMVTHSWENSSGDSWYEQGYEITSDMGSTLMPILINTSKITTTGMWETISADTSDAYPHSDISGGYEWIYCGRISDFAPSLYPLNVKTVNITSASWNNGTYSLQLPCKRYLLWSSEGVSLLVDNGKAYGSYTSDDSYSYDQQTNFVSEGTSVYVGDHRAESEAYKLTFAESSITITQGRSSSLTLAYLPI